MMLFRPNPSSGVPIYLQLMEQVKHGIETGALRPGEQLPGIRPLAEELVINPNTVAKAYAELTTEGWLDSRQGLGLYVAPLRQRLSDAERERRFDDAVQRFVHDVVPLNVTVDEVQTRMAAEFHALTPRKTA